jgi:hypothetical protein
VRSTARAKFTEGGDYHFDLPLRRGAMIAPPADSFNPNKEIGFDSP